MPISCPSCSAIVATESRQCERCGFSLTDRGLPESTTERRQLSVIFCDLVNSSSLALSLDPEDLLELYRAYQETCGAIVSSRGGHVAEYLGDGIVVYFGYPAAREGDERRAVQAALEVVDAVSRIPMPTSDSPLQVRASVHTGLVVIGTIGSRGNLQRRATGETTLVAFSAQNLAPPNSVVVTEATRRLVEGYFIFERLDNQVVVEKVQKAPIDLFRVLGQTNARRSIEAAVALGLTPFVGRDRELEKVRECFALAREGPPRAVFVTGEPGIGKSRLIRTFKEQLAPGSARLIEWDCGEDEQKSALSPVTEWLSSELGFGAGDSDQTRRSKLVSGLSTLLGSDCDAESVRLLASLLSVSLGDEYAPLDLTPDNARRRTLGKLVDLVRAGPTAAPCVLVVEDLHWADMSTLELIGMLLARTDADPLLILLTTRMHRADEAVDQVIREWQTAERVTTLELGRLSPSDATTMLREVTRGRELPDEIALELAQRSEGVPLFVEELARTVLESGMLPQRRSPYAPTDSLEHNHIPVSLQNLLQARLDRLPSLYVAQVLSALGRSCTFSMIRAVVRMPEQQLLNHLDGMVKTDLISVAGTPPDARYRFRHAMIRDAAYRSASQREMLPRLHRDIAKVLVEQFPETASQQPELVAHHLSEAKEPMAAIPQWIKAGTQALARSANHESVRHLERGLKELKNLPPGTERDKWELTMRMPLGPALMATVGFSHERIGQSYKRANELASQLPESPEMFDILWGLWAQAFVGGQLFTARGRAEQLMKLALASGEPCLLRAARHARGFVECYSARYDETIRLVEEALADFNQEDAEKFNQTLNDERRNTNRFQFSSALALLDMGRTAHWMLGRPEQSLKLEQQADELAKVLAHAPSTAFWETSRTWFLPLTGHPQKVRDIARQVTNLSEENGYDLWPRLASVFDGWARIELRDLDGGLATMIDSLAAYRRIGGGILRTQAFALLAEGMVKARRTEEAMTTLDEAFANARETGEVHFEPELYRVRGLALLQQAERGHASLDAVRAAFQQALELARQQKAVWLELRAALSLARLAQGQAEQMRARQVLTAVCDRIQGRPEMPELRESAELLSKPI